MFRVKTISSPMIGPLSLPTGISQPLLPSGPVACAPQIHNSQYNGRDFVSALIHPITPAACLSWEQPVCPCSSSPDAIYDIFLKEDFTDARVVECIEKSISKTNDRATRSISRKPYGKWFRVIITLLVICFYLSHLSRPGEKSNKMTE